MGATGAILGGVGAVSKSILGAKQASKARKAIENYQRQELTNAYDQVSVSTLGADLQREELARATATGVDALQRGGVRGVIGGIGALQQGNIQQSRQIGADLDRQQSQIDQLRAGDDANIRALQEQRENADLAGLGQQLNVGQQNLFSGIGDLSQGITSFANVQRAEGNQFSGFNPKVSSVNQLQTFGNQIIPQQGLQTFGMSNPFLTQ